MFAYNFGNLIFSKGLVRSVVGWDCQTLVVRIGTPRNERKGDVPWLGRRHAASTTWRAFEVSSKRRNSFPSETSVKRGDRMVHSEVELHEKLGRNDLCPCGSGLRFQALLHEERPL